LFSVPKTGSLLVEKSSPTGSPVNWNMLAVSSTSVSVRDVRWGLSKVMYPHVFCMSIARDSVWTAGWWIRSCDWGSSRNKRKIWF
jgi:hypothetical protein